MIIIPARLSSTRLPKKVLADINGTPMVIKTAQQAQKLDDVVIATDSKEVVEVANKYNIKEFEMYLSPHRINNFLKYIILNLKKKDYKRHLKELRKRKKSLELKLKPDYINNFNFFFRKKIF